MRTSTRRTLALLLSLLLSVPTLAETKPDDAPKVIKLSTGGFIYNNAAHLLVDGEMRRLQEIERIHKEERWFTPIFVSVCIGFLVGVALSVTVWYLLK